MRENGHGIFPLTDDFGLNDADAMKLPTAGGSFCQTLISVFTEVVKSISQLMSYATLPSNLKKGSDVIFANHHLHQTQMHLDLHIAKRVHHLDCEHNAWCRAKQRVTFIFRKLFTIIGPIDFFGARDGLPGDVRGLSSWPINSMSRT